MEPMRFLCGWFMSASNNPNRKKFPPLLDLINPSTSRIIVVLQYLSRLLAGKSPRLMLIYYRLGHKSIAAWRASDPDMVALLTRSLRVATSQVWVFHWLYCTAWPWGLFAIADHRRDDHHRIVNMFLDTRACDLPFGMARKILRRVKAVANAAQVLLSQLWRTGFLYAAWMVCVSIAPLERMHATNRRNCHPQMSWSYFSAQGLAAEARAAASRQLDALREDSDNSEDIDDNFVDGKPDTEARPGQDQGTTLDAFLLQRCRRRHGGSRCGVAYGDLLDRGFIFKALSPAELHRHEYMTSQRKLGRKFCVVGMQAELRQSFAKLRADELDVFRSRANYSKTSRGTTST